VYSGAIACSENRLPAQRAMNFLATKYWRSSSTTSPALPAARAPGPSPPASAFPPPKRAAPRGGDQALELAPRLQHQQLLVLVDLGDADAVPTQDHDHVVLGEAAAAPRAPASARSRAIR
jgi:hypothetical protein